MVNITHKSNTLRKAIATATVQVSLPETIQLIKDRKVPKGDVFEFARAAGLLAIKKTSDAIPDCHPLPVEFAAITYHVEGLAVLIQVEVHTIYKTGVEVEAMHGAAITALVIYDMLKPVDKHVEIRDIKLLQKTGGKSDIKKWQGRHLQCAVIVCSDSISRGENEDRSGEAIVAALKSQQLDCADFKIIPDSIDEIQQHIRRLSDQHFDLIILTGGTGLSQRDVTPEAVEPLLDKTIPGVMELARSYGQTRSPFAMLSRGVAGFAGDSLVITLPGSVKGAAETMDALFPQILHVFDVRDGKRHS